MRHVRRTCILIEFITETKKKKWDQVNNLQSVKKKKREREREKVLVLTFEFLRYCSIYFLSCLRVYDRITL